MAAPSRLTCAFCSLSEKAKYTCPRCNAPFCSTGCYASPAHASCSEDFYKDWVCAHLKSNGDRSTGESKQQIIQILEKLKRQEEKENFDSDDDETPDIGDRFAEINIDDDNLDVDAIWSRLTEKEKNEFKSLVDSGAAEKLLPIWKPWWTVQECVKLIQEIGNPQELPENLGSRPALPSAIPKLETFTKATPSVKIKYNVANVLYAYAFVTRFYNGDHHEFPVESVEAIMDFSESLSKNVIFDHTEQAILSAMKQIQQNREMPTQRSLALIAAKDVKHIVMGPSPRNPKVYVLSALSDLIILFEKSRKLLKKEQHELKVQIKQIERKLNYYLSWANDYHAEVGSIVLELDLVEASLDADWTLFEKERCRVERHKISEPAAKPKIEEIN